MKKIEEINTFMISTFHPIGNEIMKSEISKQSTIQMPDFKNSDGTIRIHSLALWVKQNKQLEKSEAFAEISLKPVLNVSPKQGSQALDTKARQIEEYSEQRFCEDNGDFNISRFHSIWNEIMKSEISTRLSADFNSLLYAFEERFAIMVHDGNMSESDATRQALLEVVNCFISLNTQRSEINNQ